LSYNFPSKKIRSDTENFTLNLNKPAATKNTMNNDDFSLFSSSDPEDLDHVGDDVNISVGSNELKVIDSPPETNKNDIGNYLSNNLSIDDNLKYLLFTLLDQKSFGPSIKILPILPIIFFDTREVCPLF
jgi:hypothetical protein